MIALLVQTAVVSVWAGRLTARVDGVLQDLSGIKKDGKEQAKRLRHVELEVVRISRNNGIE